MFRHQLDSYQEDFDFIAGTLPEVLLNLWDPLERAQAILKKRNNHQIGQALESLDWMLRTVDELMLTQALASNKPQGTIISRVKALLCLVEHIDVDDLDDFPEGTWADYFATLVIAYVAETLYTHNNPTKDLPPDLAKISPNYPALQASIQTEAALEAMDAIGHAERFAALDEVRHHKQREHSERSRKAAKIRVEPFNKLRQRVIEIYLDQYTRLSNREAANRIWEQDLSESEQKTLNADEPKKRLEIWIGQYKRTQQAS